MGLYLRKSVKVGPLRFNLSKSGVGVSAGVRGLRFGAGPRGNYVHMGSQGIYYRATLPTGGPRRPPAAPAVSPAPSPQATHEPLQEIESADVSQIVDSSSAELLGELNAKRKRSRNWPFAATIGVLLLLVGSMASWPPWVLLVILVASIVSSTIIFQRDILAKTAVVFYEFDADTEQAYELLHKWGEALTGCASTWHIAAQGAIRNRKYHAGASTLVSRQPTFIRKAEPPDLKTNVETLAMGVGRQVLHFFPDRVLVYDRDGVGAVSYSGLEVAATQTRFIEDGAVPRDATVVDKTWKYVNKSGGPDRRFKDNRQLPICLYDEISLRSATGLNEVVQVSRCDVAAGFVKAIEYLASRMSTEGKARSKDAQ